VLYFLSRLHQFKKNINPEMRGGFGWTWRQSRVLNSPESRKAGTIFIYAEEMGWFDFGLDHPFKPERAVKTYDLCQRYGVMNHPWMEVLAPEAISRPLLFLFHEPEYIEALENASRGKVNLDILERGLGTPDNPILSGIYEWSLMAAGGTFEGMQRLLEGDVSSAFNPLGGFHHAMPGHAEGFCYLNDIAIALKHAVSGTPPKKIAYVDLDAHHGNGVQQAFYGDSRVLCISVHETGRTLYPGSGGETETGEGEGRGFNVNIPLEPGTDDEVYEFVLESAVFPLLRAFSPEIIVAVLGADTMTSDPLTHLKLTNNCYKKAVQGITNICPRVLALGGGGYDIYRTARCWTLAWSILNQVEPQDEFAGLVGGMMFGPEMEVGSLFDHAYRVDAETRKKTLKEAERVLKYIHQEIFPTHNL
jgi:acetoin utilization protein AcuC